MLAGLTLERDEGRARKGERQRGKGRRVSKTGVNPGGLRDEGRRPVINSHLLTNMRAIVLDTNAVSSSGLIVVITPTLVYETDSRACAE